MRGKRAWMFGVVSYVAAIAAGCSSSSGSPYTNVEDEQTVVVGTVEQVVTLRKVGATTKVTFAAGALPVRQQITVRLVSGVPTRGRTPVNLTAVEIVPAALAFSSPARLRQTVPPPRPHGRYAAVSYDPAAGAFVQHGAGRRVDDGAAGDEVWEVDVEGSGLWGIGELDEADAGVGAGDGTLEDEVDLVLGDAEQTVVLGRGPIETRVVAPAQPARSTATVQLWSGIVRRGARPANGSAVRVLSQPGTLATPLRAQQRVSAPPAGRGYVVVTSTDASESWTVAGPARKLPSAVMGRAGLLAAETVGELWEMPLPGTGIYALAVEAGGDQVDGGPPPEPAALTATPATLAFGSVATGEASAPFAVEVRNTGEQPSGVPSAALAGADAALFSLMQNGCTAVLAPGASCSLMVVYAPKALGAHAAELRIAANPGGQATVALAGIGQPPGNVRATPTAQSFGSVLLGMQAQATFTIRNPGTTPTGMPSAALGGTNAAAFAIAANTCTASLAPAATCKIDVTFKPTAPGPASATLTLTANPGGTTEVALAGTGLAPAKLTAAPSPRAFGTVPVGDTAEATFTVKNTGDVATGALTTAVAGAGFVVKTNGCTAALAAGASCWVAVALTPQAAGAVTGTLTVGATPGGKVDVPLTATAVAPEYLMVTPGQLAFPGTVVAGSSAAMALTVKNVGAQRTITVAVAVAGAQAADFAASGCAAALAPGATCAVSVVFKPSAAGTRNASVTVSEPLGSATVPVTGVGLAPAALTIDDANSVTEAGSAEVGSPDGMHLTITVRNTGGVTTGPVASTVQPTTDFAVAGTTCASLPPGGSCTVDVAFTPSAAGPRTATVTVAATPGGSDSIAISGDGDPFLEVLGPQGGATTSHDFGGAGTGSAYAVDAVLHLSNTSASATVQAPAATVSAPGGDFAVVGNQCGGSLAPGATCAITVRFTAQALGARTGTLHVTSANAGGWDVALQGDGLIP